MPIAMIGLNYRRTGIDLREQVHLGADDLRQLLAAPSPFPEQAIISTCNRLEVYAVTDSIANLSAWAAQLAPHVPASAWYIFQEAEAIHHLLRVSAGLDSLLIGEAQILGQVSDALEAAQQAQSIGPVLSRLFTQAITAGKRVRTETDLNRTSTSWGQIALRLAAKHHHDLLKSRFVIIGAGEIAKQVGKAFRHAEGKLYPANTPRIPLKNVVWVNRNLEKAQEAAQRIGGQAQNWSTLPTLLANADVVITATSAPHPILTPDLLPADHPLILVDLSLPRNIAPQVDQLPAITRYDLDHLKEIVAANVAQQQKTIPKAEAILAQEALGFEQWQMGRRAIPTLQALRQKADSIAQQEVQQALQRLGEFSPQQAKIVEQLGQRIINKLLHDPTIYLKENAAQQHLIQAIQDCFKLPLQWGEAAGSD